MYTKIVFLFLFNYILLQDCSQYQTQKEIYSCQIDLIPDSTFRIYFEKFKYSYNKTYPNEDVENYRFKIFRQNVKQILVHNKSDSTYEQGINQFVDLTEEEFEQQYLSPNMVENELVHLNPPSQNNSNTSLRKQNEYNLLGNNNENNTNNYQTQIQPEKNESFVQKFFGNSSFNPITKRNFLKDKYLLISGSSFK